MQKKDNPSYVERSYGKQREKVLDVMTKKHVAEWIIDIRKKLDIPQNGLEIEYVDFITDQINRIPRYLSSESVAEATGIATAICTEEFTGRPLDISIYKEMVTCYILLGHIPEKPIIHHRSAFFVKTTFDEEAHKPFIEYIDDNSDHPITMRELVKSFPFSIHFDEHISQRDLISFIKEVWPPNSHLRNQWEIQIKRNRKKTEREVYDYVNSITNRNKRSKDLADEVNEKFGKNYMYYDINWIRKEMRDRQK